MFKQRDVTFLATLGAVALVVWSCERPPTPVGPPNRPMFWGGGEEQLCPTTKFTGGGRIDPPPPGYLSTMVGKVTFGFNIHADAQCNVLKGQFEIVHHPTQTKYHSVSFEHFDSFVNGQGGRCFHLFLTMRAKHGNGDWHPHSVGVQACDNGEPGSSPGTGPDWIWFKTLDGTDGGGHGDTGPTPLTGGNIQAH